MGYMGWDMKVYFYLSLGVSIFIVSHYNVFRMGTLVFLRMILVRTMYTKSANQYDNHVTFSRHTQFPRHISLSSHNPRMYDCHKVASLKPQPSHIYETLPAVV